MVDSVNLIAEFIEEDLAEDRFTDEDRRDLMNDIDELEEQLVTWDRDLTQCCDIIQRTEITIYRRRQGDIRHFYVREGDTLHFIGAGKRDSVYDRELGKLTDRANRVRRS